MVKENKPKYKDGDILIIEADEIIREDRWRVPKRLRRGLGIIEGDYSIWKKATDSSYFVSGMTRDKMKELAKELDIVLDRQQGDELLKELISRLPEECELKCDHILEVKTQGRMGARKKLEKIYDKLGAETGDILYFECNKEIYGGGYFVNLVKKSVIINYIREREKKYVEGDNDKT